MTHKDNILCTQRHHRMHSWHVITGTYIHEGNIICTLQQERKHMKAALYTHKGNIVCTS